MILRHKNEEEEEEEEKEHLGDYCSHKTTK